MKAALGRHTLLMCLICVAINMPSAATDISKASCEENASLKGDSARWFTVLEIMRGKAVGTCRLTVQMACSSVLRRGAFTNILVRACKGNDRWLKGGRVTFP